MSMEPLKKEDLQKLPMHELRGRAKMADVKFKPFHTKAQLIAAIMDPTVVLPDTQVVKNVQPNVPDNTPPAEDQVPLFTKAQADEMLAKFLQTMQEAQNKTVEQLNARIAELEKKEPKQEKVLQAEGLSAKDVLELFARQLKKDTDDNGMALAGVPDPADILPEPVIFWTRSPQFHMSSLRIGPVPEKLPRGHKKIVFERVYGPITYIDPNYPMPRVVCMTRYVTSDKVLVDKMRQDVRYGGTFFENFKEASSMNETGEEYRRAYEGHKVTIRSNPDPNHVFRLAKQEGITFDMNTSPERILHEVSSRYAARDAERVVQGQMKLIQEKARMEALAKADKIPIPQ